MRVYFQQYLMDPGAFCSNYIFVAEYFDRVGIDMTLFSKQVGTVWIRISLFMTL